MTARLEPWRWRRQIGQEIERHHLVEPCARVLGQADDRVGANEVSKFRLSRLSLLDRLQAGRWGGAMPDPEQSREKPGRRLEGKCAGSCADLGRQAWSTASRARSSSDGSGMSARQSTPPTNAAPRQMSTHGSLTKAIAENALKSSSTPRRAETVSAAAVAARRSIWVDTGPSDSSVALRPSLTARGRRCRGRSGGIPDRPDPLHEALVPVLQERAPHLVRRRNRDPAHQRDIADRAADIASLDAFDAPVEETLALGDSRSVVPPLDLRDVRRLDRVV